MLRRVVANFRRQDWAAVVVELAASIIGVFIGVQASNWNEGRQKNQKAAEFTECLKAVFDYPCVTGLAPETVAASAAIPRTDSRFAALLRLRIADIGTDLADMTVYFDPYIREPLRHLAKDKP